MSTGEYLVRAPRLWLRFLRESDRAEFIRVWERSQANNAPWFPAPPAGQTSAEAFDESLDRCERGRREDTEYRMIGVLDDGRIASIVNLSNIVRKAFESATIGWSVNAELAGQGYTTEAVAAVLDFAFATPPAGLGLHRVQAAIIPHNAASLRVAEKNGFVHEGLARQYLKIAGRWQDHVIFAKLSDEHPPRFRTGDGA